METLILSWYDGGFNWSIRFRHMKKINYKSEIDNWFKEIKDRYENTSSFVDFVNWVFKKFKFIKTIIICEDGYIEVYDRNKED